MNINNMMKQAQAMQQKMAEFQEKMKTFRSEGTSGGGLVKVILTGQNSLEIDIDPSLLKPEEKGILEDLIAAAFQDAHRKLEKITSEEMTKVTGGLQLPPGLGF